MTYGEWAEVILTVIAALIFATLAFLRYESIDHRFEMSISHRLVLIDFLLVVAGIEMVSDALRNSLGDTNDFGRAAEVVAVAARGAMIAGAITLMATFRRDRL